jgi:hypothetical protein
MYGTTSDPLIRCTRIIIQVRGTYLGYWREGYPMSWPHQQIALDPQPQHQEPGHQAKVSRSFCPNKMSGKPGNTKSSLISRKSGQCSEVSRHTIGQITCLMLLGYGLWDKELGTLLMRQATRCVPAHSPLYHTMGIS